jgi:hypothetical protein
MLGVFASDRILNEKTARSQLIGGSVTGLVSVARHVSRGFNWSVGAAS